MNNNNKVRIDKEARKEILRNTYIHSGGAAGAVKHMGRSSVKTGAGIQAISQQMLQTKTSNANLLNKSKEEQ